jgi:dihydrofolate reductase
MQIDRCITGGFDIAERGKRFGTLSRMRPCPTPNGRISLGELACAAPCKDKSGIHAREKRLARAGNANPPIRCKGHSLLLHIESAWIVHNGLWQAPAGSQEECMGKVFVNIALSLDGYMVPEGMNLENWGNPAHKDWGAKWGAMTSWIFKLKYFRDNLKIGGPEGDTGPINEMFKKTTERIGANIMGKGMFEVGEVAWPEDAPFHTPVYVLTHEKREPWVRPGGTTFHFVNDGVEAALEQARASAGERDIRIAGGPNVIQQYLNTGVVEELEIALAPVLFGGGRRLFENLSGTVPGFKIDRVLDTPLATHLRYIRA